MTLRPTHHLTAFILVLALCLVLAPGAFAHSPFDCSTRIIVHADSAEVMVTLGPALGEQFLARMQVSPQQLPIGHRWALSLGVADTFFAARADGTTLAPREADVVTDGLEFQFHFEFLLAAPNTLRLESLILPVLPSPRAVPLVAMDENGNIFGSAILTDAKTAAEFSLPPGLFSQNAKLVTDLRTVTNPPSTQPANLANEKLPPTFGEFLWLGLEHILTGYDHLLFLTALLLGCRRLKPMLLVITGFTLAHSFTLALAALDLVSLSSRLVEPAIAFSILFVAAENFRRAEKSWQRYAITCGFGLIHGFGFASALRETGLGAHGWAIFKPLFAFNLGVEAGQLAVALILLPVLFFLHRQSWFQRFGDRIVSALVMLVAAWWLVVRGKNCLLWFI